MQERVIPCHDNRAVWGHRLDRNSFLEVADYRLEGWHTRSDILVDAAFDVASGQRAHVVGSYRRKALHLRNELIEALVAIGQRRFALGERGEDDIAQLHAVGRDRCREGVVELDEELGEVVHEDQENPQCTAEDASRTRCHLALQERGQEAEEPHQTPVKLRPTFVPRG